MPEVYRKVMYYFFSFPQISIGLSMLAKNINSSKNATKESVEQLVSEGLLNKAIAGNSWIISLNQKSPLLISRKIPYNLQMVYESGIIPTIYQKYPNANAIILFGSYRWGVDNESSDIDIAVEVTGSKFHIEEGSILKNLGYRKNVKVNMHIFSRKSTHINLLTNIYNGIILDGLLEIDK